MKAEAFPSTVVFPPPELGWENGNVGALGFSMCVGRLNSVDRWSSYNSGRRLALLFSH